MPTIPLFSFGGGPVIGLNGISQALALQNQQLQLQAAVRNNARDSLNFQSELDALGQFADARQAGLSPSQALFQQSQNSLNPQTAQAGLNNFVNRSGQLAPFAIEAAQGGNQQLFNSVFGGTGVQFNASNPTSGFSGFGPQGAAQQANFNIRNNLLGGALSSPASVPASQQIAPQFSGAGVIPQSSAAVRPQQFSAGVAQQVAPTSIGPQFTGSLAAAQVANAGVAQQFAGTGAAPQVAAAPIQQQFAASAPQAIVQSRAPVQQFAGTSFNGAPAAAAVAQQFAGTTFNGAPVAAAQPQTRVQQNAQILAGIRQATQPRTTDSIFSNALSESRSSRSNPQSQRLEAVSFPTVDRSLEFSRQQESQRRRLRAQQAIGFSSIFGDI